MIREIISCIRNFPRHVGTALKNIWRNGVMSISSIFAVTITLIIIGVIGVIAINIQDMTVNVESSLTIHVQMERDATQEQVDATYAALQNMDNVASVVYSDKESELQKLIEGMGEDGEIFEEYQGEENPLGDAFVVEAVDGQYLESIATQIENMDKVNRVNYGGESTTNLVNGLETVRNIGSVFIVGLTVIALFMIANTIKITITSRSTEISIMRMVGASNWYIRIPFMLEGVMIGLLGSVVPILILYYGYNAIYGASDGMFISNMLLLREPDPFVFQFGAFLAILGSSVGLVGSFMSVRKFLKF